ncbi:DNA-binding protein from phage origin [Escherichia coli]|nr:DNA-binding protein from phage origin [Escherichia coli]
MNELINGNAIKMTSIEIAELVGKLIRHEINEGGSVR